MAVKFTVVQGQTATLSVMFSCANENEVIIADALTGARVWSAISSNSNKQMEFNGQIQPKMTVEYVVSGQHKESGWDPGKPWLPSREKVVMNSGGRIAVRYEDGDDGDYNDAAVEIVIK